MDSQSLSIFSLQSEFKDSNLSCTTPFNHDMFNILDAFEDASEFKSCLNSKDVLQQDFLACTSTREAICNTHFQPSMKICDADVVSTRGVTTQSILDAFEGISEFMPVDTQKETSLNSKDGSHENFLARTSACDIITCGEEISTTHFQLSMKTCGTDYSTGNFSADTSLCGDITSETIPTTHFQPSISASACGVTTQKIPVSEKKSMISSAPKESKIELVSDSFAPKSKRQKLSSCMGMDSSVEGNNNGGQQKMAHVTVERNRRKQMNENLSILRSLMPCFYVKRGDQASIIGGVVNYITELQEILQSLQSKKQRKLYTTPHEFLSPRSSSLSPLKSPLSPRTPQSSSLPSPYNRQTCHVSPSKSMNSAGSFDSVVNELVANCKSDIADVEVKFSGENVLVQSVSPRIQGQVLKMINVLENLGFEIMQVDISSVEETMITCFTIKIGIECGLSAEELAQLMQQTFS